PRGLCALRSFPTRRSSDLLREQRGLRVYSRLLHQSRLLARADRLADYDVLGGLDADRVVMFHLKGSGGWIGRPTPQEVEAFILQDRKSTRLNSSHVKISYA